MVTDYREERGPFHVIAVVGSLRKASINRHLLNAARELAPEGLVIEAYDLAEIPLYNGDLDTDALRPEAVTRFAEAIRQADGLLLATPEYNYSVPGVLKNALDWVSRAGVGAPVASKPAATMGATGGPYGTARAQEHLKLLLLALRAVVMPAPGVLVNLAGQKFDAEGHLTDEATRKVLTNFLEHFHAWIERVGVQESVAV